MAFYGYTWEPVDLHTPDGYTVTMFHVTGKVGETEPVARSRGPMLIQHPMGNDAANWLYFYMFVDPASNAIPLRLYDDGFDVWFANNRGTRYSTKHDTYDYKSKEYWDFTWYDVGNGDNITEIDYLYDLSGEQKVNYLGFS